MTDCMGRKGFPGVGQTYWKCGTAQRPNFCHQPPRPKSAGGSVLQIGEQVKRLVSAKVVARPLSRLRQGVPPAAAATGTGHQDASLHQMPYVAQRRVERRSGEFRVFRGGDLLLPGIKEGV